MLVTDPICRTCGHRPGAHSPDCRWIYQPILGASLVPCSCPRWELDTRWPSGRDDDAEPKVFGDYRFGAKP